MDVNSFPISGLLELRAQIFSDERGYFFESYNEQSLSKLGISAHFVQDNQSYSYRGVLRGLHYQQGEAAQGKLVRVISGRVLDVAVDLRPESPTYLQHQKVVLSAEQKNMLWVPRGLAHGFLALEDSVFFYKCDNPYNKAMEQGIRWDDPTLNIDWGTHFNGPLLVSVKDSVLPCLE